MGMLKWALEQSQHSWKRQTGTIAMLRSESRRARDPGTAHPRLLVERNGRLFPG
jgi:hypothetical protein